MDLLTVIGFSREIEQFVQPRLISFSTIYTIYGFYASPYLIQYILRPTLNKTAHTADCKSLYEFILNTTMSYLKHYETIVGVMLPKLQLQSSDTNEKIRQAIDYIIDYSINILISCCSFYPGDTYQRKLFFPTFEFFQSLITETNSVYKQNAICIKLRTALINNIPKPTELLTIYEPILKSTPYINKLIFLLAKNDAKGMQIALANNKPKKALIFDSTSDGRLKRFCKWLWDVGAISGSLSEAEEKSLLCESLHVALQIQSVQQLVKVKSVIYTSIMYVTWKYPRFLSNNQTFMETVIDKCFEMIGSEDDYLKMVGISSLYEIFSNKQCSIVYLTRKEFWNKLISYCKNMWMLNMDQKDKLNASVSLIISYESDLNKALQYSAELNAAFWKFPKNNVFNRISPPVPINYMCFRCKSVGKHWITECSKNKNDNINNWFDKIN